MRYVLPIVFMLLFYLPRGFTQDAPPESDYASLMDNYQKQAYQLREAADALAQARQAYAQAVKSAVMSKQYANLSQAQVDWMIINVPGLVCAEQTTEQQTMEVKRWVGAFSEYANLDRKSRRAIQRGLERYVESYHRYSLAYSGNGNNPPPSPPPPPPPQQHH